MVKLKYTLELDTAGAAAELEDFKSQLQSGIEKASEEGTKKGMSSPGVMGSVRRIGGILGVGAIGGAVASGLAASGSPFQTTISAEDKFLSAPRDMLAGLSSAFGLEGVSEEIKQQQVRARTRENAEASLRSRVGRLAEAGFNPSEKEIKKLASVFKERAKREAEIQKKITEVLGEDPDFKSPLMEAIEWLWNKLKAVLDQFLNLFSQIPGLGEQKELGRLQGGGPTFHGPPLQARRGHMGA